MDQLRSRRSGIRRDSGAYTSAPTTDAADGVHDCIENGFGAAQWECAYLLAEPLPVERDVLQHLADRVPADDRVEDWLIAFSQPHVHGVGVAEQIMQVT